MTSRPVLTVLAGVNGAGKSSIGGHLIREQGFNWFNPDTFARKLILRHGATQTDANAEAWNEGMRRLNLAMQQQSSFAFETTLGGRTVPAAIRAAAATHDVFIWYCGLASPEMHIDRVRARVAAGGHDIPESKIRERYRASILNLINLIPVVAKIQVWDNSAGVKRGSAVPDPVAVATIIHGKLTWPKSARDLQRTPDWAKPILQAASRA